MYKSQRENKIWSAFKYLCLIFASLLIMIGFLIFNPHERSNTKYKRHISLLPKAMNVTRVIYSSEEAWGFGPGGNETGIIVYEMPEKLKKKL